ncbi:hypothetical protein [Kocuria sp.]|uniref:hypothetical protein n=1 Tax=Kocuria sp. TaxID=1871328 RepID=UPI0026DEDBFA|nr:hypothetical protein [Kocuria sp.]MDO5617516.1 hypothetical protein [Kocuria sp.]
MTPRPYGRPTASPSTDPEEFAALCRSSPWRWDTVRFTLEWLLPVSRTDGAGQPVRDASMGAQTDRNPFPVRAWIRRPHDVRVETLDGHPLYTATDLGASRQDFYVASRPDSWLLPPPLVAPVYRRSGLVERRPEAAYGDPVFGGGRWQAVLDPVELVGSAPAPAYLTAQSPAAITHVRVETDDAGRTIRRATVTPRIAYTPREPGHPLVPAPTDVAIDQETGICVATTVLDGPLRGAGHRLQLEAVDDYLLDDLFTPVSFDLTDVSRHVPWVVGHGPAT